jgi:hypothetical protein
MFTLRSVSTARVRCSPDRLTVVELLLVPEAAPPEPVPLAAPPDVPPAAPPDVLPAAPPEVPDEVPPEVFSEQPVR